MKHSLIVLTMVLALAACGWQPAEAGDDCWAAFGGFLGGLVFGKATHGHSSVYYHYSPPVSVHERVYITRPYHHGYHSYYRKGHAPSYRSYHHSYRPYAHHGKVRIVTPSYGYHGRSYSHSKYRSSRYCR